MYKRIALWVLVALFCHPAAAQAAVMHGRWEVTYRPFSSLWGERGVDFAQMVVGGALQADRNTILVSEFEWSPDPFADFHFGTVLGATLTLDKSFIDFGFDDSQGYCPNRPGCDPQDADGVTVMMHVTYDPPTVDRAVFRSFPGYSGRSFQGAFDPDDLTIRRLGWLTPAHPTPVPVPAPFAMALAGAAALALCARRSRAARPRTG